MHPIKEAATHRQGVFVFVPVADLSGGYGGFGRPPTTLPSDFFTTWLKPIFFQLQDEIRVLKIKSLNIF